MILFSVLSVHSTDGYLAINKLNLDINQKPTTLSQITKAHLLTRNRLQLQL